MDHIEGSLSWLRETSYSHPILATSITAVLGFIALFPLVRRAKRKPANEKKDVVYLHQFPRASFGPNASPFCMKLETYLRMAKIPFEIVTDRRMSPKGKMPWIELNGEAVSDSSFCIERCNQVFCVDLDQNLSGEEKSICRAFKIMCEEHLYWCLVHNRWNEQFDTLVRAYRVPLPFFIAKQFAKLIRRTLNKQLQGSGIGRHSSSEIHHLATEDIRSIALFLGPNKPFFMGMKMTEVDATIFAFISNYIWGPFDSPEKEEALKWKNLEEYCQRMKKLFYPDWDKILLNKTQD